MITHITLFNNILKNFSYLESDFIGIGFSAGMFLNFVASVLIAILFLIVYFQIGRKIRLLFFRNSDYKNFNYFINIALGYIFTNSGLAVLGLFSLLYPVILWTYIGIVLVVTFYPFAGFRIFKNETIKFFKAIKTKLWNNKLVCLGIFLFVLIAFLRLIPSEIGEDAIGYHTSNPHLFLKNHTTIIPSKMPPYVIPVPHLGEMSYVISEFVGNIDSARYIHFSFYLLVVLLLILINPYSALFFVTAPVVIQVSSKANVDFQWILCWLLLILIFVQNKSKKINSYILTGILLGGVFASKLWTIAFFPVFILYLLIVNRKSKLSFKLYILFIFTFFAFLIDLVWLLRSFIISGNPLYPMLSTITTLDKGSGILGFNSVIGFNKLLFNIETVKVLSPLFFLGIAVFLFHLRFGLNLLRKLNLSLFFILLGIEFLFIQYYFGRYLLGIYVLGVLVLSMGIKDVINKFNRYKILITIVFGIMFTYYFINTLLILPYGFGWADNNKYLTRIIARDNANYFDFNRNFDKWISNNDKVATYGIYGFYYAKFDYIDINYIFDKNNRSFDLLLRNNVTKLFIKGGDITWFCQVLSLRDCNLNKVKLLANYSQGISTYYFYNLIGAD